MQIQYEIRIDLITIRTSQDRLKRLKLPTLKYMYRRIRGDMIEVYKILTNDSVTTIVYPGHLRKSQKVKGQGDYSAHKSSIISR